MRKIPRLSEKQRDWGLWMALRWKMQFHNAWVQPTVHWLLQWYTQTVSTTDTPRSGRSRLPTSPTGSPPAHVTFATSPPGGDVIRTDGTVTPNQQTHNVKTIRCCDRTSGQQTPPQIEQRDQVQLQILTVGCGCNDRLALEGIQEVHLFTGSGTMWGGCVQPDNTRSQTARIFQIYLNMNNVGYR